MNKKILVTGGAGFIGSALIRNIIANTNHSVVNVDKLTYAGNLESLSLIENSDRYSFELADICDSKKVKNIIEKYQPNLIIHLAAESHVDKSINTPSEFMQTNIIGTYVLLEQSRMYWRSLETKKINLDSFMYLLMKFMEILNAQIIYLLRQHDMLQVLHIRPLKLVLIIWFVHGIELINYQH